MLHCIGDWARELDNTFNFSTTADLMKLEFESYFNPRKKYYRFVVQIFYHLLGQFFDDYLTELRKLSSDCELGDLQELLLRDGYNWFEWQNIARMLIKKI